MLVGAHFKRKRELKSLSQAELASMIRENFEPSLFWDFENFDDNDMDGRLLGDFKRYCAVLDVPPTDFADIPASDLSNLPLPELVKARREEKNLSIDELSELIGYQTSVVVALETGCADSEVCIDALRKISCELDIPFRLLLEKI